MLPFKTIQEAESAIGRSLTTAETIWFNYSANKSDYYLYCHNILFLFLIFSCVPLYYLFLEFFFRNSIQSYKIQPKVNLSLSDVFRCYKVVMRMFILVVGPLQLVSYPSVKVLTFLLLLMLSLLKKVSFLQCVWWGFLESEKGFFVYFVNLWIDGFKFKIPNLILFILLLKLVVHCPVCLIEL